ncbi:unnamed protein product [Phytophthora fragariaefolia]|uniref:Unnamed protein product n=1 Tax=Phytophthora fragariaefolia TaxID=1490495 RepID=A0A9W7D2A6_9STRA|nr:unnamed protein product [Phytophthora fragariaefolia]
MQVREVDGSEVSSVVEDIVRENVADAPDDPEVVITVIKGATVALAAKEPRSVDPKILRAAARLAVFRVPKEVVKSKRRNGPGEFPWGNGGTVEVPPLRDKVPEIESYCGENVGLIWGKLCERTGRPRAASAKRRRRRSVTRGGSFDFSSLYKHSAEALEDWEFYPERDENISHYVSVVRNACPSRTPLPRTRLVEVVTVNLPNGFGVRNEGEDGYGVYRVVEDG